MLAAAPAAPAQPGAPLAVLSQDALRATGRTRLDQALQALLPSLNLPSPSVAGAADHVHPVTLRGLGADQLVVRINGRRRQAGPLLTGDPVIGRGEPLSDLAGIPLSAVAQVALYAGDAARFGFGAVAGVLEVTLLEDAPAALTAELGLTSAGDGAEAVLGGTHRAHWSGGGRLQLSAELAARGASNRAAADLRPQYFAGDPRNGDPPRVHQRFGEPDATSFAGFLSATQRVRGRIEAYGDAGYSVRRSVAAERWRTPSDDRTVRALFPDGLLPLIAPTLQDGSATAGLRGRLWGWRWDASVGYARSTVHYTLEQSNNASLGTGSPTRFDAGTLRSDAFSAELQARGRLHPGGIPPLSVELGAAQRDEGYQIEAGEPDSYRFGAVPILDGPHAGQLAPIGAQGFTAFRPGNAVIRRRGMLGASGALSSVLFRRLTLGGAAGLEYYRALGATLVYTLRGELAPLDGVALRGSYASGARVAPLSQSWYSTTASMVTGPVGIEDRTVPVAEQVGVLLGARPLRPERSTDLELGGSVTRIKRATLRADYYRIRVDHRVILSGTFKDPAVGSFLAQQGFPGIGAVRFFANALTTRTSGLDASASYRFRWREIGVEAGAGWSHHVTHAGLSDSVPGLLAPFSSVLFDRSERARYEQGQPQDNLIVTGLAERRRWSVWARAQRAGAVSSFGPAADGSLDQRYGAKWLADLSVGYLARPGLRVTLGAENLLGTTPDRNRFGNAGVEGNSHFGTLPYPNISPFGFAGRRLFLRASWQ